MTLDAIDWRTLTVAEAKRLIGAAKRAEQVATDRARALDTDDSVDAAMAAYQRWEDLQVFILTGERAA